jgi:hypothetical protein
MQLVKTSLGQAAFKERSPLFSARQRSAFILFDGKKTVQQVFESASGLGVNQDDVDYMVAQGFLESLSLPPASAAANVPISSRSPEDRYMAALPIATQLTAGMGLRGFRLNLAVEAASGYDDLLALLPKISEALGIKACRELEDALKG